MRWTDDMLGFMRDYVPGHTEGEIRAAFRERFGIVLTDSQIGNAKTRLGVRSGTCGGKVEHQLMYDGAYSFTCSSCGLNARFTDDIARAVPSAIDGTEMLWNTRYERTCHMVFYEPKESICHCDMCGEEYGYFACEKLDDGTYTYDGKFCRNCGAKVVE